MQKVFVDTQRELAFLGEETLEQYYEQLFKAEGELSGLKDWELSQYVFDSLKAVKSRAEELSMEENEDADSVFYLSAWWLDGDKVTDKTAFLKREKAEKVAEKQWKDKTMKEHYEGIGVYEAKLIRYEDIFEMTAKATLCFYTERRGEKEWSSLYWLFGYEDEQEELIKVGFESNLRFVEFRKTFLLEKMSVKNLKLIENSIKRMKPLIQDVLRDEKTSDKAKKKIQESLRVC